jgi:hypothetical protein
MRRVFGLLLLAGACAHAPVEMATAGVVDMPYTGKPAWMNEPPPGTQYAARESASDFAVRMRSPSERQRELRGLLADADALLAANDDAALPPLLREIAELLRPYPDITAEIDEARELAAKLPTIRPIDRLHTKHRIEDLLDLIRLQLYAAR